MRDATHVGFVDDWACFVRDHPGSWQRSHAEFLDAQSEMNIAFLKRLLKQKEGREKIIRIYGIKNLKGYARLLG